MDDIIRKLELFYDNTRCKGNSAPNIMRALADFVDYDLVSVIDELHDWNTVIKKMRSEVQQ